MHGDTGKVAEGCGPIPASFAALPGAGPEYPLRLEGRFCVEVFCGCAVLTLGLLMASVLAICPWDVRFGQAFDVLVHGQVLVWLAEAHTMPSRDLGETTTA